MSGQRKKSITVVKNLDVTCLDSFMEIHKKASLSNPELVTRLRRKVKIQRLMRL